MTSNFPAEWQTGGAVMIAWPHEGTDWAPMLGEIDESYKSLAEALASEGTVVILTPEPERVKKLTAHIDPSRLLIVKIQTDDTWTRDYGPLTIMRDGKPVLLDFMFNGWGLKFGAANDNLATSRLKNLGVFTAPVENCRGFVFEGGSIESDGAGTLLTTSECLLSPNRNAELTKQQIEDYLLDTFHARQLLWLDHGALAGDDTDSHIDTLARLAPGNTIVYTGCSDRNDEHFTALADMAGQLRSFRTPDGQPFNLIELPLPDPIFDEDGCRLPATYANYLVTPTALFIPVYGQPMKDKLAADMLRIAFPDHRIYTVNCCPLIKQHGSLHCATMQLNPSTICI